jgi:hypothetical protein
MVFSPAIYRLRLRYYRAFASGANGEVGPRLPLTVAATRMSETVSTA